MGAVTLSLQGDGLPAVLLVPVVLGGGLVLGRLPLGPAPAKPGWDVARRLAPLVVRRLLGLALARVAVAVYGGSPLLAFAGSRRPSARFDLPFAAFPFPWARVPVGGRRIWAGRLCRVATLIPFLRATAYEGNTCRLSPCRFPPQRFSTFDRPAFRMPLAATV